MIKTEVVFIAIKNTVKDSNVVRALTIAAVSILFLKEFKGKPTRVRASSY